MRALVILIFLIVPFASLPACRSTYYSTWEKLGKHKRDLLVDRVEEGRDDQEKAKQQFRTALEKFSDVVKLQDTNLKNKYDTLKSELDRCESRASAVSERIDSIEQVSADLFEEWKNELKQYSSDELRRASERQLDQTRARYDELIAAMKKAEQKMQPVLTAFRDHVLFLKHNLNAQAIASLQGELTELEDDTAELIREMEAAIAEADRFITEMKASG
jgi:hypothetical protein